MLPRVLALFLFTLSIELHAAPSMCINGFRGLPLGGVIVGEQQLMRVADEGTFRSLFFRDGQGEEKLASRISLLQPEIPILDEHRELLASFLLTSGHEHSLVMGLRNIGLIRFLRTFTPAQIIDVVDQDPAMITVANEYFNVRSDDRLTVRQNAGLEHLLESQRGAYDVIYLDHGAMSQKDSGLYRNGVFLDGIRDKLKERGALILVLDNSRSSREAIDRVIDRFPHVFVWETADNKHVMMAALKHRQIVNSPILRERATRLDQKINAGFSFGTFVDPMLAGEYRVMEM